MGLNQYIVLLADTGAGKNSARVAIDKIYAAIDPMLPHGVHLRKGLGTIPSPQGLLKSLAGDGKDPNTSRLCCLSLLGEIGLWLQEINDKKADANRKGIRRLILDLFTASGGSTRSGDIGYSDSAKNVGEITAPAYSILGDSTQHAFYKALNEDSVAEGFLTRFTVIEYQLHTLPEPNPNHNSVLLDPNLLYKLVELVHSVVTVERMADSTRHYNWIDVPLDDASQKFDVELERKIRHTMEHHNRNGEGHLSSIWSRFQEKTLRLAALLAVGVAPQSPCITMAEMGWAHDLVMRGTEILIKRFQAGHVGDISPHIIQHEQLLNCLREYLKKDWQPSFVRNYGITQDHKNQRVITYRYIHNMLHKRPAFRNAHNPKQALDNMIQQFVSAEYLAKVAPRGMEKYRGTSVADMWIIVNTG